MNKLELLYQGLFDDGRYTRSFEEFKTQMSDPIYRRKLYDGLFDAGDFTRDFGGFERDFTPLDYDPNIASRQTFGTDDATMTVERPSAGAIDFVEDATDLTKIRPVGEAEIRTEEAEIVPELERMYGHLGFEFDQWGVGDYVKVKHKDDTGNGIRIAVDQWTSIGNERIKNKINTYLAEWSKHATEEDIKKTHEHHERVGEIIKLRDEPLTPEEENNINQAATADLERTNTQSKISDFFKVMGILEDVKGAPLSKVLSSIYNFMGTAVDPNSEVIAQAARYWENEQRKDPDLIVTEEMVTEKIMELKIKEERNNIVIGKTNKYLSDLDWEAHDYYEQIADEKLENVNTQIKANDKNIQKIKVLEDTYTMDTQEYNDLYRSILRRIENGEEVSQAAVDMLDGASLALREKRDFINKLKEPIADLFIKQQDALYENDYLDNVNHTGLNMLLAAGTALVGLGGSGLHFREMIVNYAQERVVIPALSAISGADPDIVKDSKWYKGAMMSETGLNMLGDYLKGVQDDWEGHKKMTTKGYVNFFDAAEKGVLGFFENLPQIVLAAYTGGGSIYATMAIYGVSGAGDKHYRMEQEVKSGKYHYTPEQMILAPLAHGAFESITMIPETLMLRGALKGYGKFKGSKGDVVGGITPYHKIGRSITGFSGAQSLEISQEVATQIGQNATDKFILGKENVHLADGLNADFFIKTIGATGTFYTAPRALSGMLMMSKGMYLESDQEAMNENAAKLLQIEKGVEQLRNEIAVEKDVNKKKALEAKLDELRRQRDETADAASEIYWNIFNRFGKMSVAGISKLRTLAKQSGALRLKAREVKKDENLSNGEKKKILAGLEKEFQAVEDKKSALIDNKNKYKLEHGNRINSLEKQALSNLKEKSKGKTPTQEQIEKEAERIFDEGNYESDAKVNEAKNFLKDQLRKTASDVLINNINEIDPNKPIEKFEGSTLEQAVEWLEQNLKDKGISKPEIKKHVDDLKKGWKTGTVAIFQPKVQGKEVNPDTHEFDKHQIVVVNAQKSAIDPAQWTSRGHDIFHAIVWKAFKASGKGFKPMAEALLNRINSRDSKGFEWLMGEITKRTAKGKKRVYEDPQGEGRMVSYMDADGNPTEAYYEEVLMAISDGMRRNFIRNNPELTRRIKTGLKAGLKAIGIDKENENVLIRDAQDMLNIIEDYGKGLDKRGGQVSSTIEKLIKGKVEVAEDITPEKQTEIDTLSKQAMDMLSTSARNIVTEAKEQTRKAAATKVNNAYNDYTSGKIGSWEMLQIIGEEYKPMFKNAIRQFENENNITFGKDEIDTFIFEAIHSSRGIKGSLLPDANKPNKVIYIPGEGRTPARYLNGLLPQRMIEFGVKAIPNLDAYYAEDITTLKNLEAKTETKPKEQHKPREQRNLNEIDIVTESVIKKITRKLKETITRALVLDPTKAAEDILNAIETEIENEYSKIILAEMGEIHSEGDRVIPSEEYKSFFDNNFDIIWKGLPIATIKKKYSKLFNIVKVGRELTPQGNPVFNIKPISKAKFASYFLNGKLTTLRARQRSLAAEIAQSLAKDAAYELAKDPDVIARIEEMQDIAGFSSIIGVQNEIKDIGNQLDKKKGEKSKFDEVKWAKDINELSAVDKKTFFGKNSKTLIKLGKRLMRPGETAESAFNYIYPGETFGGKRDAIIKDIQKNIDVYATIKKRYDKAGLKVPRTVGQFVIDQTAMASLDVTMRDMLGLDSKSLNDREIDQLHSARVAVIKIAEKLGIEKAERFLRFLYASGKIGAYQTLEWNEEIQWYDKTTEKLQLKIAEKEGELAVAKKEKRSAKEINKIKNELAKLKQKIYHELETLRYGLFAGRGDIDNFVFSKLKGYKTKYRSKIEADAAQSVSVVNQKGFNVEGNSKSAKRNKVFLKELMEIMGELEKENQKDPKKGITKNDIGMVMMALAGDMKTPLAAAAEVRYVSNDGKKSSATHIYEHLITRKTIGLHLTSYAIGKTSESDIDALLNDFTVAIIPKDQAKIVDKFFKYAMPKTWVIGKNPLERYFNMFTFGDISVELIDLTTGKLEPKSVAATKATNAISTNMKQARDFNKAVFDARITNKPTQGITVLDFDDTLATTESLVRYTAPDGTTGALNAEQYASQYQDLLAQGYEFDFTEFDKVVKAKLAPLFNKALKLQKKFGPENMFILTARPAAAQQAIRDFLKANGLNIPLKNIATLGNSTAEAKALWVAKKVGEGYNDFYFADDALQNVQAVKNMLDQFDVKSKVQQARSKQSKDFNSEFNDILEEVTGMESKKRFSATKARKRGGKKGKWRFFIPPSHEDFSGLLYNFMGKGKKGDAHRNFFERVLLRPLNRAFREFDTARQSIANDYKSLNKEFPGVKDDFNHKIDEDYTVQDAIRVYLWDKHGYNIPGLSKVDQQRLVDYVKEDAELQAYAETLNIISKRENYINPTEGWDSGDIRVDLDDATGRIGRSDYFAEFNENADILFSKENLNKIEAIYGEGVREALEDVLYRIQTGKNRPRGNNKTVNIFINYLNGSVGVVMFLNMRSAILQQLSNVNYLNFADNNIFAAGKAFLNQKQYWTDWAYIFNSDMLKQRRGGIRTDVNAAELAETLRESRFPGRVLVSKLLQLGFTPTQIGDSIAIATGGATFYRNRIKTYLKEGLSKKEAEAKAWTDFQSLTQSTQQSARPDMVSQQQASPIGKFILNFQNITSQYNRFGKKAFLDIFNRRITPPNKTQLQSDISNASRIMYYFAVQNMIFYGLQTALFAAIFDGDEEDEKFLTKKKERMIHGSIDSILRGTGWMGAVIATLKNMGRKFAEQRKVGYNPDESGVLMEMLNVSPVIGIKAREISNAEKTLNYNKKVIKEMETFDIDNPLWSAVTNYTEGITNIPVNRLYKKTQNVRQSLNNEHKAWQRVLMFLGWSQYNLGIKNPKIEQVKKSLKKKPVKKKRLPRKVYH